MPGVQTFPTQSEIDNQEQSLKQELVNRAPNQISEIQNESDVHIRDILPEADLDQDHTDNDNGWNGTDRQWIQSGLTADQLEQVYEIDPNNKAENKLIGFMAFSNINGTPLTSEIVFRDGTGSVFERAQVQEVFTRGENTIALMEQPIIVNASESIFIDQWPTGAGDDQVVYHGAVAEKVGNTLGERQPQQGAAVPGRSTV